MEDCIIFCRYKNEQISRDELRILLDLHDEEEYKVECSICGEEIKF